MSTEANIINAFLDDEVITNYKYRWDTEGCYFGNPLPKNRTLKFKGSFCVLIIWCGSKEYNQIIILIRKFE